MKWVALEWKVLSRETLEFVAKKTSEDLENPAKLPMYKMYKI